MTRTGTRHGGRRTGELDITDELIAERRGGTRGNADDMTPWMADHGGDRRLNLWAGRIICLLMIP